MMQVPRAVLLTLTSSIALVALGCGDGEGPTAPATPEPAPDTRVIASRLGESEGGIRFHFVFEGSSTSQPIVGFEWQLGEPVSLGAVEGGPVASDWVRSDSHELDLTIDFGTAGPGGVSSIASAAHSRTLWVRARDARGRPDPIPAHVTMTRASIAPEVVIDFPTYVPSNSCAQASRVQTFGWTASDPDGSEEELETRFILHRVGSAADPCLTQLEFQFQPPIAADDPNWSDWIPYDPAAPTLDPSRSVTLPEQPVGESFLFAVQARDGTGSVTTTLQWGENVRHFRVGTYKYPLLTVFESSLGLSHFVGTEAVESLDLVAGPELSFQWSADATAYLGYVVAYRFGWDVVDPDDPLDPGWVGSWGDAQVAPPRALGSGVHTFVVGAMDNSGAVTRATFLLSIQAVPARADQRDVLLVYDWPSGGSPGDEFLRAEWTARWARQIEELVFGFDARRDVVDAQLDPQRVDLTTLLAYRSVVWFSSASELTFLHTRLAPQGSAVTSPNWLESYQRRGGNLLLAGPGVALSTLARNPYDLYPIVFDAPAYPAVDPPWIVLPDGSTTYVGTLRWPYTGWCLSATDLVRPALMQIYGEMAGQPLRSLTCDQLARAEVAVEYVAHRPAAVGALADLHPAAERLNRDPQYKLPFEEFYDVNVTTRSVTVVPRDCQVPMFVHRSMRDEGHVADPSTCPPPGSTSSALDGATNAIESAVYSDSKPLLGSHDFLWGFHPLAFEEEDLRAALRWVFLNDWELATAKR